MNRWKMNKLGFLNFWLYDQEEFSLHNGHILLRGNNGSGKSITTQSFIPFLLDGDRSPQRLDPFGSRDRKMEFYLLGEDEKEEATGYLYLEFKREALEEYLTIGVGMRAQRGKKLDFWGFCLCDGRRIGPDGVCLYEKAGGELLPLTRQKLFNRIGSPDYCVDRQEDYKKLVNNQLFHFRDIRQYDQLVQLLINVRAPKLSKDFRPSKVRSILNDSLQLLTDEDLSAMASTMDRLDVLKGELQGYQEMVKSAQIIQNEYQRYNQLVLGRKAQAYLEARKEARHAEAQRKAEEARGEALAQELAGQSERAERSGRLLEQAKAQRAALGEDNLSAQRTRLEQLRKNCTELAQQLEDEEGRLRREQEQIAARELLLQELTRSAEDARVGTRLILQQLKDENTLLELGEAHESYLHAWAAGRRDVGQDGISAALQQRKRQIDEVRRCLERLEQAKDVYAETCRLLDAADEALNRVRGELRDAELLESRERDQLLEGFTEWQSESTLLRLPAEEWQQLRRALLNYHTPADWGTVRDLADNCRRRCESTLVAAQTRAQQQLDELEKRQKDKQQALQQLKNQPEPIPPRREAVQAMRTQLLLRGIPCAAFYETVDFAPGLSESGRDLLEAQLSDAGLLDALLVPPEHLPELRELLAEYPDRFLLPSAPVEQPLTALVPEGAFSEQAAACLCGISCSDLEAQTALLPDGRFRSGMVQGRSHVEAPAGYIGAAARRRNRERQLQALEQELTVLAEQAEAARKEDSRCAAALEALKAERDRMPSAVDLDHALEILSSIRREETKAVQEREHRQSAERSAYQAKSRLDAECRSLSAGLPYRRDIPSYEEAGMAADEYQSLLLALERERIGLISAETRVRDTEQVLEEQRDRSAGTRAAAGKLRKSLESVQAEAAAVQEVLDRPENRERAQQLERVSREIEEQERQNRDASEQCAALRERLAGSKDNLERAGQTLLTALENEWAASAYFAEDLALGFSGLDPEAGLEHCAREAAAQIRQTDRERTPEQVQDALSKTYQQHNHALLRYHPEMKVVFEPSEKPFLRRQRQCITLRIDDREVSLFDAIRILQGTIQMTAGLIEEGDRELFEEILTETVSNKLRARISESRRWTEDMTNLMATLRTSMGLTFRLKWRPKRAETEEELDTDHLVRLLDKNPALMNQEDSRKISAHFRAKVKYARAEADLQGLAVNYIDLIRSVLDYRNWYEFQLFYRREGETEKELTDRAFNRFSGGEKAMAMYVPMFASVSAQYQKGSSDCPLLLALDEAFAGVDDRNIGAMFELVRTLGFDYIMNSQALWGCYACVDDLDIAELHRPSNARVVTILRYYWNGSQQLVLEDG